MKIDMNYDKNLIEKNYETYKLHRKPIYIVVHDTQNESAGADAIRHYHYFKSTSRQVSAHFMVDDKIVIQLVDVNNIAWHVGDGKGKYGITNMNSIGVELCVNQDAKRDEALKNLKMIVSVLMRIYNIPKERVVRHYDASKKLCPKSMSANNWREWYKFKEGL